MGQRSPTCRKKKNLEKKIVEKKAYGIFAKKMIKNFEKKECLKLKYVDISIKIQI